MDDLKTLIREIPDYPKPGILFYDLTTLLKDPKGISCAGRPALRPIRRNEGGHGRGNRGARIYFRAGAGVSLGCGIRSGAQTEETARQDDFGDLRSWSMAPISWRFTPTRSSPAKAC